MKFSTLVGPTLPLSCSPPLGAENEVLNTERRTAAGGCSPPLGVILNYGDPHSQNFFPLLTQIQNARNLGIEFFAPFVSKLGPVLEMVGISKIVT